MPNPAYLISCLHRNISPSNLNYPRLYFLSLRAKLYASPTLFRVLSVPVVLENVPALQKVHFDCPVVSENEPARQGEQAVVPLPKVPTGQGMQLIVIIMGTM